MPGPKTNEREGTRAVLRYSRMSPYKAREVIDLIRNRPVHEASDVLRFVERDAAVTVEKLLGSAVANAVNNDGLDAEELYVSACFVDEGPTAKRWRPRARGRATRIRKRSCHITIIVSRLPEERLARLRARRQAENLALRARRVEATRRARAESSEGASRRERRHPEAFPAPEEEGAEEVAADQTEGATAEAVTGEAGAATEAEGTGPEGTELEVARPEGTGPEATRAAQVETDEADAGGEDAEEAQAGPDAGAAAPAAQPREAEHEPADEGEDE